MSDSAEPNDESGIDPTMKTEVTSKDVMDAIARISNQLSEVITGFGHLQAEVAQGRRDQDVLRGEFEAMFTRDHITSLLSKLRRIRCGH